MHQLSAICFCILATAAMAGRSSSLGFHWGAGLSQNDLMEKDTVLVVDENDQLTGSASKKEAHVFSKDTPYGILHRAFSVFLFDQQGRLLLQQRASSKITFPNVWTNTCCSHPLHGMEPSEVDSPKDVASGKVMGVKHAAVRKLEHELGIPVGTLDAKKFQFLTRLHYWAADTVTHGKSSEWGEHEVDYVLFYVLDDKEVLSLNPNPDEVDDTKFVTMNELDGMLANDKLLFSPWFRLVVQKWLRTWWSDLATCMKKGNKYCDYDTIHEFDPPSEHFGGGGNAQPIFALGDSGKKQGAYGKIVTHKESKVTQMARIHEIMSAITLMYIRPLQSNLDAPFIRDRFDSDALAFCNDILVKVSRSFASVIRQLPDVLLVDILVFYLVLRALDTIEDDMTSFTHNEKMKLLMKFHSTALKDPEWKMMGIGQADERRLLEEFPLCHRVFAALSEESKSVISDITVRMATGMAEFVGKDLGQGTKNIAEYNRYCHFVAGLVGEGLSRLFAVSGLESPNMAKELHLSDQMGLFLQKTNIIRDYLEDYVDKRAFWPQSVWKKHSQSGDLGYFARNVQEDEGKKHSLACLNELVADALELVPDCLIYMKCLQCQEIFRFCAIPQVMAIATLDKCYNNPDVFTGVVKIRKGLSCQLLMNTNSMSEVHATFYTFAKRILSKARSDERRGAVEVSHDRTIQACETIMDLCHEHAMMQRQYQSLRLWGSVGLATASQWVPTSAKKGVWLQSGLLAASVAWYYWLPKPKTLLLPAKEIKKIT